ncbi:MAG: Acryloyl-CoA reductase AcuI/YhdH [Ktedonobacterales bacterium]|jgi:acrylyl-CoA reductase (NADPH)|nr:MAG: Acryloyl-CoA reductase AcuI/YhdH [Ktedonobacterales bacterium]
MRDTFKAIVLEEHEGAVTSSLRSLAVDALPEGDVLVAVAYSDLNYKDGLAITGRNKVVRSYPMVPGIDFAGTIEESRSPAWKPGDRVVLTGWGVGERHWGGFAQLARVKSEWLVPVPSSYSLRDAAAVGTAGVTAMMCVMALEAHGLKPADGKDVLVTGATGGVGSMAVALLASLGYRVVASTGRAEAHDYLTALGAHEIVERSLLSGPGKPLDTARWGGAVDTVGGDTLAGVLRTMAYGGSVAACGNAGGIPFTTTILPFILRGVNLLGIDSLPVPGETRRQIWARLERDLPRDALDRIARREATLAETLEVAQQIVEGGVQGRVVINVNE